MGVCPMEFRLSSGSKIPVVVAATTVPGAKRVMERPRTVPREVVAAPKSRPVKKPSDDAEPSRPPKAPRDDDSLLTDKHAELLRQSNHFLEISETFKLKADVERLMSRIAQLEDREKKHVAAKKKLAESNKVLVEQNAELTQQNKELRETRAEDKVKIRDLQAQLDRKRDKAANVREAKKDVPTAELPPTKSKAEYTAVLQERHAIIAQGLDESRKTEALLRSLLAELDSP
ncbi:hypothetical protein SPRG_18937 [Saprolegnia parasitica CBS 223.65]|uniref:Uncharacterized protein n=1 Tax=Saprolegnia parasitica (strain CBS 223.65) TaxID=695850 RepID=A0A067D6U7_SAPPC|nr:hypothetical protein SPRG_18937 [Saprolegnia parasitica CBS 223.65]KDO34712.1 hypothetical protein SPRG_18937 [Saprolegnia parasitica CBS 223.65]|eukprot:XP_012194811.1 hypothetical protein SPRG_18937 [Saprolegnia parasitica CBS 223.65]